MSRTCQNVPDVPAEREEYGFTVCGETGLAPSGPIEKRWFEMAWNLHHWIPINQLVLVPSPPVS